MPARYIPQNHGAVIQGDTLEEIREFWKKLPRKPFEVQRIQGKFRRNTYSVILYRLWRWQ